MVDFKKLGQQAKSVVDKRGGTDALKEDAAQLKEIATGKGTLSDKAKAAAAALKDPGAAGTRAAPATDAAENRAEAAAQPPAAAPPAQGEKRDRDDREGRGGQGRGGGGGRGKHRRDGGEAGGRGRDDV